MTSVRYLGVGHGATAAPDPPSSYPNEPAGLVGKYLHDASSLTMGGDWNYFARQDGKGVEGSLVATTFDGYDVLKGNWPHTWDSGFEPFFLGPNTSAVGDMGAATEVYIHFYIYWVSPMDTGNTNQKMWFFNDKDGATPYTIESILSFYEVTADTTMRPWIAQQGQSTANTKADETGDMFNMVLDQWYRVEAHMVLNSAGTDDGEWYIWLDETLVVSGTSVRLSNHATSPRLINTKWDPTWNNTPGTDLSNSPDGNICYLRDFYISTKT